ncbi:MAG: hypothetical protein ABIF01_02145 [Candidatus Micrarchaeota archaeon]
MNIKFALASLMLPTLSFAQNVSEQIVQSMPVTTYSPLINSPYLAASLTLLRDITIIVVLWVILYKQFGDDKKGK